MPQGDARLAYEYLVEHYKVLPSNIIVVGESAGDGLTMLTLLGLRDANKSYLLPVAEVSLCEHFDLPKESEDFAPPHCMLFQPLMRGFCTAALTNPDDQEKARNPVPNVQHPTIATTPEPMASVADAAPASSSSVLAKRVTLKPFGALENLSASCPWAIFPRKKLDITYHDVAAGLQSCFTLRESQRDEYERRLTRHWDPSGHSMVTLSVRTGFDLLLQTLKLPKGSEILCSAITIPDMLYLVKYHGLVAVPVDLDPQTLAVDMDILKRSVTKNTKAILIAHIFGSRFPLEPVLDFADEHDLMVIEDCAQAFSGMNYTGERRADVSMFSFGSIKTATAFGGALVRVKNPLVLEEMKRRERRYPSRTNLFFFQRLLKYGFFHGVTTPAVYGIFLHACRAVGANHDQVITSAIRGFSGGELVSLLQFRPSMALLGLLYHRLSTVDDPYINLRKLKSEQLRDAVGKIPKVQIPAISAEEHYYWLFPVVVPSPQDVVDYMNAQGFDVTSGATQLAFVPSPYGAEHDPKNAKFIMTHLVYLPVTAEMPEWALKKMVECFRTAVGFSRL